MNIGYNGIARMIKQAKLDKAKQSVNYGRTPGSSGSVDTRDYSSPYVHQQNSNQDFSLNSEGILSLPGSSPTTTTGSASMIPPDPSSLVSPFSKKAKNTANSIYGDTSQRQQSLANPPLFKLNPMYNGEPGVQKEDFEQF